MGIASDMNTYVRMPMVQDIHMRIALRMHTYTYMYIHVLSAHIHIYVCTYIDM